MNILVVDHSKVFRAMWRRTALDAGHEPIMVSEAREGLATLRQRPVDLVCVARTLADVDGIEFVRQARAMQGLGHLPIILLTSTADKDIRQQAFDAGVTDVHPRTDIEDLFHQATQFVRGHRAACSGRVLYVEDSRTLAKVMLRVLEGMGLEVDHYTNASEALAAFEAGAYDLVISDILVEGEMSGIGLISRIREQAPEPSRSPILAISGMEDANRRIDVFRLGGNDFVTKPVLEEEVRSRVSNLIMNKQLIEQVEEQRRRLFQLAMTDQLTGLYNRNSLSEFAERKLAEANRHDLPLSVILLDIDHFKSINDTHGHLVGDEVLAAVGELLQSNVRDEDFPVRFGGEELLLLLSHCGQAHALERAQQLRAALAALEPSSGVRVTASLGVSARPLGQTVDFDALVRAADQGVYQAKDQGRDRVVAVDTDAGPGARTAS
ncbi:MAG: diguanylate cyclase response regulator [Proteobacteria bacterium SW_6_67_9]|nr:MAG: diguanylate cyclase response regulator [Proteobacteria bacterium SW_6_67_9]